MGISLDAKNKEEIIPFLLKVGFNVITTDESILKPYYEYKDDEMSIKISFNNIGLNGGSLIHVVIFDKNGALKTIFIDEHAIGYLNNKFKYKFRKEVINKLLGK